MKTPFIWLGSGRARKRDVGTAGTLLDTAARAGLPVPPGGILLDDFYRLALEHELVVVANGRVRIDDPDFLYNSLYEGIRFPLLDGPVRVRGLFSEPADEAAGLTTAVQPPIDPTDGLALADTFSTVWQAAQSRSDTLRRDILIQQQISAQTSGTAVIQPAYNRDLVTTPTDTIELPQIEYGTPASLPDWAVRLQKLLRGLRRTTGAGSWRVEWADDGDVCWLLHVDALHNPPARNDRLTRIRLGDMIPERPSPFLTSSFAEAGRRYAALCQLPPDAELVVAAAQRPWLNQTLIDDARQRAHTAPLAARLKRALARPSTPDLPPLPDPAQLATNFTAVVDQCVAQLIHVLDQQTGLSRPGSPTADLDAASIRPIYDKLRGQLLTLAETAVANHQIPAPEALWLLTADEMRALDAGTGYSAERLAERTAVRRSTPILPDDLQRFDVGNAPQTKPDTPTTAPLAGHTVVAGTVSGRAWLLAEPTDQLPTGFLPHATILVAPTLDADWLPTLSLVAGVILERGETAVALLEEVGLPAVVGVGEATRRIGGGSLIKMDGAVGRVWIGRD